MQVISTDAAPSAPASTVDMSAFAKINKAGADTINSLRTKIANLEQRLKHVQGLADIASSKSKQKIHIFGSADVAIHGENCFYSPDLTIFLY